MAERISAIRKKAKGRSSMKLIFTDADSRSYERSTAKPITVEVSAAVDRSINLGISAADKSWLSLSVNRSEAAAIGHALLAACQNVSTTSVAYE